MASKRLPGRHCFNQALFSLESKVMQNRHKLYSNHSLLTKNKKEMNVKSFSENIEYSDNRIATQVILETSFSKEIRILLKKGQTMKEHQAPFPIIVHILEGKVNFGLDGDLMSLKKGDVITLESKVSHDLTAKEDSVVRLTLSKLDDADRVKKVADRP